MAQTRTIRKGCSASLKASSRAAAAPLQAGESLGAGGASTYMIHNNDSHANIGRQMLEQPGVDIEATGRTTNTHKRKIFADNPFGRRLKHNRTNRTFRILHKLKMSLPREKHLLELKYFGHKWDTFPNPRSQVNN